MHARLYGLQQASEAASAYQPPKLAADQAAKETRKTDGSGSNYPRIAEKVAQEVKERLVVQLESDDAAFERARLARAKQALETQISGARTIPKTRVTLVTKSVTSFLHLLQKCNKSFTLVYKIQNFVQV